MAGGFVIGGSVLLVLSVFDTFANLRSVEMRDEVVKMLASPTGEGLGLSVADALAVMRVGLMVAAACAAAAAVLGIYALQRSRQARLALSILAVPILLTAPLTGGLMGALVAAATLMLWSGPARDWFAGRQVREVGPSASPPKRSHPGPWEESMPSPEDRTPSHEDPPRPDPAAAGPGTGAPPAASELSTATASPEPEATSGFGERPVASTPPGPWVPPSYADLVPGNVVPVTVKVACILTWVFAGVVALLYAGLLVALVAFQDRIVEFVVGTPQWQQANLQQDVLLPFLWIGTLMFLGWALGACLLAWFTWRRHDWARWLLAASSAVTLLVGFATFPVGVLHQAAAALVIVGLFSVRARAWFAHRDLSPRPPSGPGGQDLGGQYPGGQYPGGQDSGAGQFPPSGGPPRVW